MVGEPRPGLATFPVSSLRSHPPHPQPQAPAEASTVPPENGQLCTLRASFSRPHRENSNGARPFGTRGKRPLAPETCPLDRDFPQAEESKRRPPMRFQVKWTLSLEARVPDSPGPSSPQQTLALFSARRDLKIQAPSLRPCPSLRQFHEPCSSAPVLWKRKVSHSVGAGREGRYWESRKVSLRVRAGEVGRHATGRKYNETGSGEITFSFTTRIIEG